MGATQWCRRTSGRTEADRERAWLEKNAPELVNNVHQEVYRRLGGPEDAETFLNSLRKAGPDFAV